MKICRSCGTENPEGSRFCLSCGSSLVPACPVCGTERPPEARFCPNCGAALTEETPVPADHERRMVTTLFADVTGSTGLGERLDPERLQELLATYFGAMREEIEAEGGTIEKFVGDAIMAAFGVPVAHEDDPGRALRAALRMRRRLEGVNRTLDERFGVTLEARMGVNTGEVLAAVRPQPGEPMVTGDAVIVAARLEQLAEPGQIVVAERTARAARGFRFRELRAQELRGKAQPVPAVLLEQEAPGRPERGVPGLHAPMVGRGGEFALLQAIYQRAVAEGRPNLVTVYGEPGVGKSRLVHEFLAWTGSQASPPRIAFGRCLPYGKGVTYWPLAEILKAHAGVLDSDPAAEVLRKIEVSCDSVLESDPSIDPARTCGAIAYTVGLEFPSGTMRDLEPRQVRAEMHAAWRSFFSALAGDGPLVVVVEDIHWADEALLDLLEELRDRVLGPVIFLCPARPELTSRRPGWGGGRGNHSSVALEPLASDEADRLVRLLLSLADLPDAVYDRILERAEGNPFFLEEIVRHMIDDGRIVRDEGHWRAGEQIGDVEIPDSVQAVLAARIDLLEADEKRALQRAAVIGRVFWPTPVGQLLNGDSQRVREILDRLEDRELVLSRLGSAIAGEPEFIFKHTLTRDVAYETLPRRERGPAHERVARWIEETSGARSREFLELLAYHYVEAYQGGREGSADAASIERLRTKAFEALMDVAGEARSRYAIAKARAAAEDALGIASSPLERVRTLEERGLIELSGYAGDEAWEAFREAVDVRVAHAPDDRASIAWACSRALENPLRWPGSMRDVPAEEVVDSYLALGAEYLDDEETEAGVRLLLARAFRPFSFAAGRAFTEREVDDARASGQRAADIAMKIGRADLASAALDGASSANIVLGLYGKDMPIMERRLALANRVHDPWEVGDTFAMGAWTHALQGDYEGSLRLGLEGIEATGDQAEGVRLHNLNWVAVSEFMLGRWDDALERFATVADLLGPQAEDPPYFMMQAFGVAAFVRQARGEPEVRPLLGLLDRLRGQPLRGSVAASCWLAWIRARQGEHEAARTIMEETRSDTWLVMRPLEDVVTAELLAAAHLWDEIPAFLDRSRSYAARAGLRALPAHLDRLEGLAALAAGRTPEALSLLEASRDGFTGLGARWETARSGLAIAESLLSGGRSAESQLALDRALPVFEELGSLPELELARALAERLV